MVHPLRLPRLPRDSAHRLIRIIAVDEPPPLGIPQTVPRPQLWPRPGLLRKKTLQTHGPSVITCFCANSELAISCIIHDWRYWQKRVSGCRNRSVLLDMNFRSRGIGEFSFLCRLLRRKERFLRHAPHVRIQKTLPQTVNSFARRAGLKSAIYGFEVPPKWSWVKISAANLRNDRCKNASLYLSKHTCIPQKARTLVQACRRIVGPQSAPSPSFFGLKIYHF
jgi:hypothetical protein